MFSLQNQKVILRKYVTAGSEYYHVIMIYGLTIINYTYLIYCHDSSVGIALGSRLDYRGSMVRFPAGAGNFSLLHLVQNGSGAHPASYPMGTRGSFPEADHSPPSSAEVKE
jgi:hypothetical protein